jgi:hypothetical protein
VPRVLCIGVKLSPHSAEAASGRCPHSRHDSIQSSAFGNMTALSSSLPYSRYYRSNSLSDHRPAYATTPNLSTKLRSTSVNDSLLSTSHYRRIISHVIGCLIFTTYEGRDACSIGAQALCTEYNCRTSTKSSLVSVPEAGSKGRHEVFTNRPWSTAPTKRWFALASGIVRLATWLSACPAFGLCACNARQVLGTTDQSLLPPLPFLWTTDAELLDGDLRIRHRLTENLSACDDKKC